MFSMARQSYGRTHLAYLDNRLMETTAISKELTTDVKIMQSSDCASEKYEKCHLNAIITARGVND
jgi:hypothetical protein